MKKDDAVSSVVSEMLLITLVLIMIPLVTISLMNQLPSEREPTVTIKMGPVIDNTVTLYHKGGDYLIKKDIKVILNKKLTNEMVTNSSELIFKYGEVTIFDLDDHIIASFKAIGSNDLIQLVSGKKVIFSGYIP